MLLGRATLQVSKRGIVFDDERHGSLHGINAAWQQRGASDRKGKPHRLLVSQIFDGFVFVFLGGYSS
jgi:hypothetical protein